MSGSIRHFQFPFSLKAMFISASSISIEQKYYQFSYSQGYHAPVTCYEAQKALSAEENSLAKISLQLACETACAGVAGATCDPSETASACDEAQKALSAEENSLAKIPLQLECETACAGDAGVTCDPSESAFACDGLSMLLIAVLAMLK